MTQPAADLGAKAMPDDPQDDVDTLRRLSIFGALAPSTIEFLRSRCDLVTTPKGGCFFEQGQTGDAVFVLRRGSVAVIREQGDHEMLLCRLHPGQCFGEVALVAISPRTATVRALEESVALRLRARALFELCQRDMEQFTILQMNLGREVARRLAVANESLFEYARRCGETNRDPELRSKAADTLK